ncbi:hypothetical protein GC076_00265 [Neisseria meningitidis]|nr:hypothetical protein [Neisseria meningitidis]
MTASVCRLQHGFFRFYVLDSRLRGNDESIHTETCTTSFLRTYIPSFPQKQKTKQKPLCRHSRAGGNLDLRTTAIFKDYLKVRDSRFPLSWE